MANNTSNQDDNIKVKDSQDANNRPILANPILEMDVDEEYELVRDFYRQLIRQARIHRNRGAWPFSDVHNPSFVYVDKTAPKPLDNKPPKVVDFLVSAVLLACLLGIMYGLFKDLFKDGSQQQPWIQYGRGPKRF
ncbi:Uncharacterized protein LW93_10037 [Fusarium fujikuroi]|nr:Uncharacterized protein LW93_10037 [Fusarium fujikuroi]